MNKRKIAYYISSHGFGHLTRSLALIEYMLETQAFGMYICSGKNQIEFAKIYLDKYSDRITYFDLTVDVGLINKENSLDVDVEATDKAVSNMLDSYDDFAAVEAKKLAEMGTKLIISDVSGFACLVADKSGIELVEIGNFTWTDQYISIGAKEDIVKRFKEIYSKCNHFIAYDLSLDFVGAPENSVLRSDYIISRPILKSRVNAIKETYGEKYQQKTGKECSDFLYLSLGKSAELPQVKITNFSGVVFYTQGIEFNEKDYPNILFVKLPNEIKDSQSFVAASDLVIAKAGWSTSAEGVVAHSKMLLIERPGVDDDMNTINSLKNKGIASSLNVDEVVNLDYAAMYERAVNDIDINKLNDVENDTRKVCEKLMSFV